MNGIIGVSRLMLRMPLEASCAVRRRKPWKSGYLADDIINASSTSRRWKRASMRSVRSLRPAATLQEVAELQSTERGTRAPSGLRQRPACHSWSWGSGPLRQVFDNWGQCRKIHGSSEVFIELSVDEKKTARWAATVVAGHGHRHQGKRSSKLFEPFTSGRSMVRRHGGTGLGLAIYKHLTELMGTRSESRPNSVGPTFGSRSR